MQILLLSRNQFGYLTDSLAYCRYLADGNEISYFSFEYGLPRIDMEEVNIYVVSRAGSKLRRNLRYIREARKLLRNGNFDLCLVTYFPFAFSVRPKTNGTIYILDVRTGSVSKNMVIRHIFNLFIRLNSVFFRRRIVVSESLRSHLGLRLIDPVIPVGAERISLIQKDFTDIRLLYVGTLSNRNIDLTIRGLRQYLDSREKGPLISYSIIGSGYLGEIEQLKKLAESLNLENYVNVVGLVPHDKLKFWFDSCNIGVSFVPITSYFNRQPPTKTFEYLLSGMPVIATATDENSKVITDKLGVLIEDTAQGFATGLFILASRLRDFDSDIISDKSERHHWRNIVGKLKIYIDSIVEPERSKKR